MMIDHYGDHDDDDDEDEAQRRELKVQGKWRGKVGKGRTSRQVRTAAASPSLLSARNLRSWVVAMIMMMIIEYATTCSAHLPVSRVFGSSFRRMGVPYPLLLIVLPARSLSKDMKFRVRNSSCTDDRQEISNLGAQPVPRKRL